MNHVKPMSERRIAPIYYNLVAMEKLSQYELEHPVKGKIIVPIIGPHLIISEDEAHEGLLYIRSNEDTQ